MTTAWADVFGTTPLALIGVVHLGALPGSPDWAGDIESIVETAVADVRLLDELGANAIMLENFNDSPFIRERVDPGPIAAMGAIGREARRATSLPLGFQVLKNDTFAALALCASGYGRFTRASHMADAMVTDVGIIQANAPEVARYRRLLGTDTLLIADIYCKHAEPIARRPVGLIAHDLVTRAKASALMVDGADSKLPPSLNDIAEVAEAVPGTPIVVGSGTPASLIPVVPHVQGIIIPSPREYTDPAFWMPDPRPGEDSHAAASRWVAGARRATASVAVAAD